jgi:hypothetical protein
LLAIVTADCIFNLLPNEKDMVEEFHVHRIPVRIGAIAPIDFNDFHYVLADFLLQASQAVLEVTLIK